MDKRYKHLNGEERGVILAEHRRGASLGAIGALLGRSASTIGRELVRGRPEGELIPSGAKADSGGDSQRAESLNLWRQVLGGHGHGYSDRIAGGF